MLSKNPLDVYGKKLDRDSIAQAIRLAIIGELDAINLYLQIADAVDDPEVRKVLRSIAFEEKIHVGELLEILARYDPEQAEALRKGSEEVKELLSKK